MDILAFLAPIAEAFKAHAYGLCAVLVAAALVNSAFRLRSPEWWIAKLDGYPRVHALLDVARAFVQPVDLLYALWRLASGAAPQPPASASPGAPSKPAGKLVAVPPSVWKRASVATMCLAIGLCAGCATLSNWWGDGGAQTVLSDAEKIAAEAIGGASIAQIAVDTGIDLAAIVVTLLQSTDPKVVSSKAAGEAVLVAAKVSASLATDAGAE